MKIYLLILTTILSFNLFGQIKVEEIEVEEDTTQFIIEKIPGEEWGDPYEEMPEFPGGDLAMMKFINDSLKYPINAIENGEEGMVYVQFNIDKEGFLGGYTVAKGISESLDKEALRIVKLFPKKWNPYMFAGEYEATDYIVPINFDLPKNYK